MRPKTTLACLQCLNGTEHADQHTCSGTAGMLALLALGSIYSAGNGLARHWDNLSVCVTINLAQSHLWRTYNCGMD